MTSQSADSPVAAGRRPLDFEDYLDAARRNRGWIVGSLFSAVVISVIGAFLWPNTFASQAALQISPSIIDPAVAPAIIHQRLSERFTTIAQSVLNRSSLEAVIRTHNLYSADLKRTPIDDVVERMRKDIRISQIHSVGQSTAAVQSPAFSITFHYRDRFKAQKVVADLVSRFMSADQVTGDIDVAIRMLQTESETAQKRLESAETGLAQFRKDNAGKLPDQMDFNVRQISALESRLAQANGNSSRAQQDRTVLETNLAIEEARRRQIKDSAATTEAAARAKSPRLAELEKDIKALQRVTLVLAGQYTEKHPDLVTARQQLAELEKERQAVLREESQVAQTGGNVDLETQRLARESDANLLRLRSGIEMKTRELEQLSKEIREINASIRELNSRIQGEPAGERQYAEIIRERDLAREQFQEIQIRLQKARIGERVVRNRLGEVLEQLDSPSLPETPTEPRRSVIVALGAFAGLLFGLAVAGTREARDTSLKSLKDVRAYTNMPLLGSIPLLENDIIVRRRRRIEWLAWTLTFLTGAALMSAAILYYYFTQNGPNPAG